MSFEHTGAPPRIHLEAHGLPKRRHLTGVPVADILYFFYILTISEYLRERTSINILPSLSHLQTPALVPSLRATFQTATGAESTFHKPLDVSLNLLTFNLQKEKP